MDPWFLQARRLLKPGRPRSSYGADTTLERLVHGPAKSDPSLVKMDAACGFILRIGRAFLSFGLPAHRLEEALERLAAAMSLSIDCFSTPTAMILTVSDGERRRTRVVRLEPGDSDLERLSALHALVGRVERKELSPSEASSRVEAILARRPPFGTIPVIACGGLASAGAAILLGGDHHDVLPALMLGAIVGGLAKLALQMPLLGRVLPAFSALLGTIAARLIALAGIEVHESVLVLAALIVLLPGFTLTVSVMELATANVVSGTSRLIGALSTLVQLGFGVALGHKIAEYLPPVVATIPDPQPQWVALSANAVVAFAFTVLLKASPRDLPAIFVGCAIAVLGSQVGRAWLGPELGAFLGATCVGIAAHVYARWRDRPVLLLLTPGILMLVPGSVGFLSISHMLASDVVPAMETAFRMILIATSLAAGVLFASVAIPPRRPI